MKLKSLAVITLLVLGCSAAFGQTYSFGFLSYDPVIQFCDYEIFAVQAPYAGGIHNMTTVCGNPIDGVMVGLMTTIPATSGAPVTGQVIAFADNTFDAQAEYFSGCQIDWVTRTKPDTKRLFHYGWSFYYSCGGGGEYLGNYGYLSATIPTLSQNKSAKKTSFGASLAKAKSKSKQ